MRSINNREILHDQGKHVYNSNVHSKSIERSRAPIPSRKTVTKLTHFSLHCYILFVFPVTNIPFYLYIMCQKYRNVYKCGHQKGKSWMVPENPRQCPEAREADRRDVRGRLLPCTQASGNLSTVEYAADDGVCTRPACYANEYLIPIGWKCHICTGINPAGTTVCAHELGPGVPCGHNPCKACRQSPSRGFGGGSGGGSGGNSHAGGSGAAGNQSGGGYHNYGYGGGQGPSGYGQQDAGGYYSNYGYPQGGYHQGYQNAVPSGQNHAQPKPKKTQQAVKTTSQPQGRKGALSTGERAPQPIAAPKKTNKQTSSASGQKPTQDSQLQGITGKLANMAIYSNSKKSSSSAQK